jgi:hypothetical protein
MTMDEYISKQKVLDYLNGYLHSLGEGGTDDLLFDRGQRRALINSIQDISAVKAEDVQPVKCCRMIPLEPDCRGYTDVFICTNCHQHIHLGFIRQEYSGSYCLECGAEVKDGDTE